MKNRMRIIKGISLALLATTIFGLEVKSARAVESLEGLSTSVVSAVEDNTSREDETPLPAEVSEEEEEEEVKKPEQNNTVVLNGITRKSTLAGNYYAKCVPGFAVITPEAELQKQAKFIVLEYFFVSTWDLFPSTAPQAIETLRTVAASENATMGVSFQMTVSRLFSNKVYNYENEDVKVGTCVTIPDDFRIDDSKYAVMCVRAGGVYEILPDLDDDPYTITFNAHAGTGAYALLRY
jgi:hypothetical protein